MDLEKTLGNRLAVHKRMRLDSSKIDGFNFVHESNIPRTPFSSPSISQSPSPLFKAEKELQNVESWNKLLSNCKRKFKEESETEDSMVEDFSFEQTAGIIEETIVEGLNPGESLDLCLVDIMDTVKKNSSEHSLLACDSDYQPLPTYVFEINHKKMRTILDTGAATNYISTDKVTELIRQKNSSIKVYKVDSQGVRLANGQREETSKMASFTIYYGSSSFKVKAFILKLPTVDLILGLPWYKETKPRINFDTGSYMVNARNGTVEWKTEIFPTQDGSDPTLCTSDRFNNFSEEIETIAKQSAPACFSKNIINMERKWTHSIDTGKHKPVKSRGRPHTPPEHLLIKQFVEDGLRDGVIEESSSPWSSPLLLVKKADGSNRVCVDYRKLNELTTKNAYPLPRINNTYQFLSGANFFSTIDLKSGFWQIQMDREDKGKTAFTCRLGHFQWKVMPFGLCNAPATFQNAMNEILRPVIDKCALVYLDDVIIYSQSGEQHKKDIKKVMELLNQQKLTVSQRKCKWGQSSLVFLAP